MSSRSRPHHMRRVGLSVNPYVALFHVTSSYVEHRGVTRATRWLRTWESCRGYLNRGCLRGCRSGGGSPCMRLDVPLWPLPCDGAAYRLEPGPTWRLWNVSPSFPEAGELSSRQSPPVYLYSSRSEGLLYTAWRRGAILLSL